MKKRSANPFERCAYLSFATRKRNGDFVPTPVWFAADNGVYYLFSAGDAGKVKRLRTFSDALHKRAYIRVEPASPDA